MSLFKGEEMPSIKGEIDKLDKVEAERQAQREERELRESENSPTGMRRRRMENAAKYVHVESFSQEALDQAQADLAEAEKGLREMLDEHSRKGVKDMVGHEVAASNSEFWHTKINIARETIRQLEALRDLKSAREEVGRA